MVKWRGFGRSTNHWDYSLKSFAVDGGLRGRHIAHSTLRFGRHSYNSPSRYCKMTSTIDDVSNGRFGVNIVSGWNKLEYSQMGLWQGDEYFKRRYEYATEYLDLLRRLWRDEHVIHNSDFFSFDDFKSYPKPSREIPIICAGQSDRGITSPPNTPISASWEDKTTAWRIWAGSTRSCKGRPGNSVRPSGPTCS